MKKEIKTAGKLGLNKQTITKLNNEQMHEINAGISIKSIALLSGLLCSSLACYTIQI